MKRTEPFLINPPKRRRRKIKRSIKRRNPATLMMINRKKRRTKGGVKKMAKRRGGRSHRISVTGSRGSLRVARRSRLAPGFASRGTMINPFAGFAMNRRRVRRYKRNPTLSLPLVGSTFIPEPVEILGGAGGFMAVKAIPTMFFPANWQVGVMKIASQGITAVGVSMLASRFLGKKIGRAVMYGGVLAIATELVGQLMLKAGLPVGYYMAPSAEGLSYYMNERETR